MPENPLSAEKILAGLKTQSFGKNLILLEKTGSTQNEAKILAERGLSEGTAVVAEEQNQGRGRMGSAWISERGGLWVSLILRPQIQPQDAPLLALVSSVAISKAIESVCGVRAGLKWPNDILIRTKNGLRKACGSLIEMSAEGDLIRWAVLGFGINVNNDIPRGLESIAVSLKRASGKPQDRTRLLQRVLGNLEKAYRSFTSRGFETLRREYMKRSVFIKGRRLKINNFSDQVQGRFVKIDSDGSLVLALSGGKREKIFSGDVTILK